MLQVNIDSSKVIVYVNGQVVWSGTLEEWSYTISRPIEKPHFPSIA